MLAMAGCVAALALANPGSAAHPEPTAPPDGRSGPVERGSQERVVLITGSTSGLGRELALRIGRTGAHVIVHGRNVERGRAVVEAIEAEGTGSARFYAADFAALEEVREFGKAILRDYDRVDILINNAGIGSTAPERQVSSDGHELRFQVNYLAHFLLTRMLLPRVVNSAPARIVNVSSAAQTAIDFDDVMLEESYEGGRAYAQSKLAQIFFTFDLAEELDGTGVVVHALHPATYMNTPMVTDTGREPMSTVDEGADAVMNLVESEGLGSGRYFRGQEPTRAHDQAYDPEARRRLAELSRELTGIR